MQEQQEQEQEQQHEQKIPIVQKKGIDYAKIAESTLLLIITHNRDEYLKFTFSLPT